MPSSDPYWTGSSSARTADTRIGHDSADRRRRQLTRTRRKPQLNAPPFDTQSGTYKGHLALPDALYIAACVADAREAAHDAGLTHRDIKPSNVMVPPNGEAKVVGFGITKGSDERHDITTTGVLIGTPASMAPKHCPAPSTTAPTCTGSAGRSTK
ncbi:hypothetical protein [Streptomyces sp. IB2014 016-6]|uniref:protein kinase domain-containing protein n=1 Tax=Streptomyces sp. IB2014 016-6 TaxID=2517818 RepID=UPI001F4F62C7|nr:hypothetical protein [Streptomyces sp. IB2014 016-6]